MSMVQSGSGTLTLTQDELNALIAEQVKAAVAQQMSAAQPGYVKQTPEEALGAADLPVTPEAAGLLQTVPAHQWTWLLSVDQVKKALLRSRPVEELATIFDHLTGFAPGGGPAAASLQKSAA